MILELAPEFKRKSKKGFKETNHRIIFDLFVRKECSHNTEPVQSYQLKDSSYNWEYVQNIQVKHESSSFQLLYQENLLLVILLHILTFVS